MGLRSSWGFCAFIFFSNDLFESKSSKGGRDANQRQIGAVQTWFVTFGFIWPSSAGWNWKPPPKDDKVVAENQLWLGFLGATFVNFPLFGMRYSSWKVSTDKSSSLQPSLYSSSSPNCVLFVEQLHVQALLLMMANSSPLNLLLVCRDFWGVTIGGLVESQNGYGLLHFCDFGGWNIHFCREKIFMTAEAETQTALSVDPRATRLWACRGAAIVLHQWSMFKQGSIYGSYSCTQLLPEPPSPARWLPALEVQTGGCSRGQWSIKPAFLHPPFPQVWTVLL